MTRKLIALVLTLATLLMCMSPMAALAEEKAAWCNMPNAGGSLHLRAWPGKIFDSVGYVKDGDALTVYTDQTGTDSDNEIWMKVKVTRTGKTGYIKTKYIVSSGFDPLSYELSTVTTKYASSRVNLRKGPGTAYGVETTLRRGALLFVKETQGNWHRVHTVTGDEGWISRTYVTAGTAAETTANVNLRKGPGTGYGVIKVLADGTDCTALAVDGSWTKVRCGGSTGWLYSEYIIY